VARRPYFRGMVMALPLALIAWAVIALVIMGVYIIFLD
jgi:hypothetical protein